MDWLTFGSRHISSRAWSCEESRVYLLSDQPILAYLSGVV